MTYCTSNSLISTFTMDILFLKNVAKSLIKHFPCNQSTLIQLLGTLRMYSITLLLVEQTEITYDYFVQQFILK